jgi:hypothetical protein
MIETSLNLWKNLGSWGRQHLRQWTKPATTTLVTGTRPSMTRSRGDLTAENALLRQQLTVLNCQVNTAGRLTPVEHAVDYPGGSVKE